MKIILKNKKTADELIDNDHDYPPCPPTPVTQSNNYDEAFCENS